VIISPDTVSRDISGRDTAAVPTLNIPYLYTKPNICSCQDLILVVLLLMEV
jgi:hypothetical protein